MNSSVFLIMLIVGLILAAGGAAVFLENARSLQATNGEQPPTAQPRLVAVEAFNNTNNTARYVRIQVTSNQPVRVNDTLITVRTQEDVARLRYREGTLERNVTEGFYTQ